jgi:hypothetical protein
MYFLILQQWGENRNSNVFELAYARFSFFGMYGAFVVHPEFKERGERHSSWQEELLANKKIFINLFYPDLARKYPHIAKSGKVLPPPHFKDPRS